MVSPRCLYEVIYIYICSNSIHFINNHKFISGSSSQPFWDGTNLARNDAIIVSFNYRLGALGWTAMEHLSPDLKGSANLGLLDQISK